MTDGKFDIHPLTMTAQKRGGAQETDSESVTDYLREATVPPRMGQIWIRRIIHVSLF